MSWEAPPVRVAIVNDYKVVVRGVAAMLHPYRDRVLAVGGATGLPTNADVDIVLLDTFSRLPDDDADQEFIRAAGAPKVVVYAWNTHPAAVASAMAQGAVGYLSMELDALELVEALEAIHRGETVSLNRSGPADGYELTDWPGRAAGLTPRESEMLAYLVGGLSRSEIAAAQYVSLNTVKTHLASVYRKLDVEHRSQAVQWALKNGFVPEPHTAFNPDTLG